MNYCEIDGYEQSVLITQIGEIKKNHNDLNLNTDKSINWASGLCVK